MKTAFTLAETLVTIGVIGIVAAMTLPTVINKIQNKQYKVAYKKAYSALNQAFLRMQANNEYISPSDSAHEYEFPDGVVGIVSPAIGENFKIISKYFKTTKTCFNNNADKCFECDGEAGLGLPGTNQRCYKKSYAFVDSGGMSWYLYSNQEYPIIVDVNGKKKPNKLGRDRFVMKFASNTDKKANYTDNADTIIPWDDHIERSRWCPSGNCMYKSWLLD